MRYLEADDFVTRVGAAVVPRLDGTDTTDTPRIEAALDSASAECRAWLPDDLLEADGTVVATPPARLADVLPGIVCDLALYSLSDGATGSETVVGERYRSARKLLRELRSAPERPAVVASMVEGASQWIPGEAPAATNRR